MEWLRYGVQHYPDRICINEYTYKDIYGGVLHVASELLPLEKLPCGHFIGQLCDYGNLCVGCYASS